MALKLGEPIDARVPFIRAIHDLDDAWRSGIGGQRERALAAEGKRVGDELRSGAQVVSVRTLPTSDAPYPVKYAFNGAVPGGPGGLLMMKNRSLLVQLRIEGEIKNLLWNPTDGPANQRTPFYVELTKRTPALLRKPFEPKPNRVAQQLAELGLRCEDIHIIAFDHFHTQDLRPLLGAPGTPARFPNALLLAPRIEWDQWDDLPQCQRAWFVPDGKAGVSTERVIFTQSDLVIAPGAVLLRTPGHSVGNQTLFVHTERGVFGSSENGTSADNWSPLHSRINAVRRYAQRMQVDVVINANTPELCAEQYASMMLERAVVDPVPDRAGFVQMFPSSEVTPHFLAPHIRPTVIFGSVESGQVVPRG